MSAQADSIGLLSVLISVDETLPVISLSIEDRQLQYDGEFASAQPKLIAFVEDDDGVGQIEIRLNGPPVLPENLDRFDKLASGSATLVEYKPTPDSGDYTFETSTSGLSDNHTVEEIQFQVGGAL